MFDFVIDYCHYLWIFVFYFCGFYTLAFYIIQEIIRVLEEFEEVFSVFLFFEEELKATDSKPLLFVESKT